MHRGRVPRGPLRSLVNVRSQAYSLHRPTGTTGWGEDPSSLQDDAYDEITGIDLDLFAPSSQPEQYPTGVDTQASLSGLCLPSEDVQEHDIVSYGSSFYEVVTADVWPDDANSVVVRLDLDERTDVTP